MPVTYMTPFENSEDAVTDATLTLTTPNEIIPVGAVVVITTNNATTSASTNGVTSITGAGGTNSWHISEASSCRASALDEAQHWLLVTTAIPANTVLTITYAHSSNRKEAVGRAYQGLTGVLERDTGDDGTGVNGGSSAGTQASAAATQTIPGSEMGATTAANCLLVAGFAYANTGTVVTAGTNWTEDGQIITNTGTSDRGVFQEHREVTSQGTYDATASFSPTSAFAGSMLAFPIAGGGGGGSYPSVVQSQSPVSYYRMGEAEGVTVLDDAMNFLDGGPIPTGTTQGRPGGISGDANTAMYFDGTADVIPILGHSISSSAYSITSLVKQAANFPTTFSTTIVGLLVGTATTQAMIFASRRNATNNRFAYWDNTNSWQESSQTLAADTWYHVALVVNGTNVKLYLNKVEVGNFTITAPNDVYTNMYIGARDGAGGELMRGDIDEVAIWSRALSAAEVGAQYDAWTQTGGPVTNPNANAGPDQTNLEPGATVTLDSSASTAGAGSLMNRQWVQTAGTPTVTITNPTSVQATFEAPYTLAGTTLTFEFTVENTVGGIDSDTVNISMLRCTEREVGADGLEHPIKLYPV